MTRSNRATLPLLSFSVLLLAGCSPNDADCPLATFATPPTVTVTDAVTGQSICDATVLVIGVSNGTGSTVQTLAARDAAPFNPADAAVDGDFLGPRMQDGSAGCSYDVLAFRYAFPAADIWALTLQVSHAGYKTADVSNVDFTASPSCGVSAAPEVVDVKLVPVAP